MKVIPKPIQYKYDNFIQLIIKSVMKEKILSSTDTNNFKNNIPDSLQTAKNRINRIEINIYLIQNQLGPLIDQLIKIIRNNVVNILPKKMSQRQMEYNPSELFTTNIPEG